MPKRGTSVKRFAVKIALPMIGLAGLFTGWNSAQAVSIYFWPPPGDSTHLAYPSDAWPCSSTFTWSHSIATHVNDLQFVDLLYVYYYDVHSGSSTAGPAYWNSMYFVDSKNEQTDVILPPGSVSITTDWTVWRNRYYGYTPGSYEFRVETRLAKGTGPICLGVSYGVYRH